jgi:hypothetical protein
MFPPGLFAMGTEERGEAAEPEKTRAVPFRGPGQHTGIDAGGLDCRAIAAGEHSVPGQAWVVVGMVKIEM